MKKINRDINTIIQSRSIANIDELIAVVNSYKASGYVFEYIVSELDDWDFNIGIDENLLPRYLLIEKVFNKKIVSSEAGEILCDIKITQPEFNFLKKVKEEDVRKLLYFALVYSKAHDHPTHWIKYDRDVWFNAMGLNYKEPKRKEIITKCFDNGLELRVIGAKQPIVCYKVNFRMDEGRTKYCINEGTPLDNYNLLFGENNE